jgi:ferredoxin
MLGYIDKIQEISERLLKDGSVDMIIGFRKGTVPLMNEPCFIKEPAAVNTLVWDSNCGINLANYLTGRKEKVGIIAKGCDSRNIVTHIIEKNIDRDQLKVIGVPCKGMVDRHKVASIMDGDITDAVESEDTILVKSGDSQKELKKSDVLQQNCSVCVHRNPVIYDEMVADAVDEQTGIDRFAEVSKVEAMDTEEKWQYFEDLLAPCIRCYACRNACPLCYCPTCFVDENRPQWVGKTLDPIDTRTFHFLRAYHCAGRCTDCGACVRACPMNIDVRAFTKKLEKDVFELYGWEAGLALDERPPLDTFKPDDPEEFIK